MGDAEDRVPSLFSLSLKAALAGEYWRVQRRQVACLPDEGANPLLAGLLSQRRIEAPQLELFQHCASEVELDGALLPSVGASWLSYLAKFRALHALHLLRCVKLRDTHIAMLAPLAPTLRVLSLAGCSGLSAAAAPHIIALTGLVDLDLSDTQMGPPTASSISSLTSLTALQLGGLPTSDACCIALARLSGLQRLVLWGSEVGDTGMRELEHLSGLTSLDLSLTRCASPPLLPALRALSMIHCQLDIVGEDREALWLDMGATLPTLEDLDLSSANFLERRGPQLLRQLVGGAAGMLRTLRLGTSNVADLAPLEHATGLTYLDLSGTPIHDALLGSLALLPLAHLALSDTGVGDEGLAQLLAMTSLTQLSLRNTLVGDAAWGVLAQLPALARLDLSGTEFAGNLPPADAPGPLPSITSLSLLGSRLGDRGCKLLARAAPALQDLALGGSGVSDLGLKALAKLPRLWSLALDGCMVSDHGLGSLEDLAALTRLHLDNCWLISEAGVAALADSQPQLADVQLNGVPLRQPGGATAGPAGLAAPARQVTPGRQRQRGASGGSQQKGGGRGAGAGRRPSSGGQSSAPGGSQPRFGRLPQDLLQYDERLRYSRSELLTLQRSEGVSEEQRGAVLAALPADLSRGGLW